MKLAKTILATAAIAALATPAFADNFNGTFTGVYGTEWNATMSDNVLVDAGSTFTLSSYNLTLRGATSANDNLGSPYSLITFTHPVVGSGPITVAFSSLFFSENNAHPGDSADFIVNGEVRQSLSTVAVPQSYTFTLNPGDVFGFRLSSDNDTTADSLQVTQVPEPGVLALAGMAGVLAILRRRS
jgi:hypothetical protein